MMMSLVVTMDQRQAVRREMIQQMEQGATASDVRRLCPIPIHRTTVYRLLKRVEREGEQAFVERRLGAVGLPRAWDAALATLRTAWPCSPDGSGPTAIGTPRLFCRRWPMPMAQTASHLLLHVGAPNSGIPYRLSQKTQPSPLR